MPEESMPGALPWAYWHLHTYGLTCPAHTSHPQITKLPKANHALSCLGRHRVPWRGPRPALAVRLRCQHRLVRTALPRCSPSCFSLHALSYATTVNTSRCARSLPRCSAPYSPILDDSGNGRRTQHRRTQLPNAAGCTCPFTRAYTAGSYAFLRGVALARVGCHTRRAHYLPRLPPATTPTANNYLTFIPFPAAAGFITTLDRRWHGAVVHCSFPYHSGAAGFISLFFTAPSYTPRRVSPPHWHLHTRTVTSRLYTPHTPLLPATPLLYTSARWTDVSFSVLHFRPFASVYPGRCALLHGRASYLFYTPFIAVPSCFCSLVTDYLVFHTRQLPYSLPVLLPLCCSCNTHAVVVAPPTPHTGLVPPFCLPTTTLLVCMPAFFPRGGQRLHGSTATVGQVAGLRAALPYRAHLIPHGTPHTRGLARAAYLHGCPVTALPHAYPTVTSRLATCDAPLPRFPLAAARLPFVPRRVCEHCCPSRVLHHTAVLLRLTLPHTYTWYARLRAPPAAPAVALFILTVLILVLTAPPAQTMTDLPVATSRLGL